VIDSTQVLFKTILGGNGLHTEINLRGTVHCTTGRWQNLWELGNSGGAWAIGGVLLDVVLRRLLGSSVERVAIKTSIWP
jgi:hypothetical protein